MLFIIGATIFISKLMADYLKIKNDLYKKVLVLSISLILYISFLFQGNIIFSNIITYTVILLSSTGGYDYGKKKIKEKNKGEK